jgi:hypothetical protein
LPRNDRPFRAGASYLGREEFLIDSHGFTVVFIGLPLWPN